MEWISVKDRLPKIHSRVLVYIPGSDFGTYGKGFYTVTCFIDKDCFSQGETHWMPLPEPPK